MDIPPLDSGSPRTRDLAGLDDRGLQARLQAMPLDQQTDLVLSLDWGERMRVIRNSPAPRDLVHTIPDEEILLTIKGVGEEDALDLIDLSSPGQLRFIFDVELWSRDSVDDAKILRWLEYITDCGEDKVIDLLETVDRELLVMVLSKLIYLIPHDPEAPSAAGAGNMVPDDFFTILPRHPAETERIKLLLRIMRQWDRQKYYRLLFAVHGSADSETEEEALRWRNTRLEEKGLMDFEEAVEIYGYLSEDEARVLAASGGSLREDRHGLEAPLYPVRLAGGRTLLARALAGVADRDLRNRLRSEIAFCANRLLVADAGNIGEIESMRHAVESLFALTSVGLDYLSAGMMEQAVEILNRTSVRDLFQIGFSRAVDLRSLAAEAIRRWWPDWKRAGFRFLGPSEGGIIAGLMKRVPQYYSLTGGSGADFRDFESMAEIADTRSVVEEIVEASDACFGVLGIPAPAHARLAAGPDYAGLIEEVDLRNLLATGFVNFSVRGEFTITPVDGESIRELFAAVMGEAGSPRRLRPDAVPRFLAWLRGRTGKAGAQWEALERFVRRSIAGLEEEAKYVPASGDPDPRYFRSVLLSGRSGDRTTE
jgi:hypothetical protein